MLNYGNNRLVARQDVWMNSKRDLSVPVVMVLQIDSAIAPFGSIGPPWRFKSLTREEASEASLQRPRICLEEFDIFRYFDSILLGDFDRLLDGPLLPALVVLPSHPRPLPTDPKDATSTVNSPSDQSIPDATKEARGEHR